MTQSPLSDRDRENPRPELPKTKFSISIFPNHLTTAGDIKGEEKS